MKLSFLGATGTVTGSRFLLEHAGRKVLVDCGLFQGLKALRLRNWERFPVDPERVDAVVLTHAHIDHSGYLPLLAKQGFGGRIYCTAATRDLCKILLPDSGYLQEEQARYANEHGFSKHKPALPLYTKADAERVMGSFSSMSFNEEEEVAGLRLTFRHAGHILGAAIAEIQAGGRRIVFSGDLGRPKDPVMKAPARVRAADYVVVESTYGNRSHPVSDPEQELAAHLRRAIGRGGVVVIPAFAVGRAQSLLHHIARLRQAREIPDVPVYLNSPMATNATRLYFQHIDEHRLSEAEMEAACADVRVVQTPEESRSLNTRSGPMIILSASGMATGGRVVHHIKAFAPDPRNLILFPGFQAAGTRGATMTNGGTEVKIHGEYIPVRAEVVRMDSLSAHADAAEILDWLSGFERPPRKTFIIHGEPAAADELRRRIVERLGWDCLVPEYGQAFELGEARPGRREDERSQHRK